MPFNELNSIEHFMVHLLRGVSLRRTEVWKPEPLYGEQWWS